MFDAIKGVDLPLPRLFGFIFPLSDHFKVAAKNHFHDLRPLVQVISGATSGGLKLTVYALDQYNEQDHSSELLERLTQLSPLTTQILFVFYVAMLLP